MSAPAAHAAPPCGPQDWQCRQHADWHPPRPPDAFRGWRDAPWRDGPAPWGWGPPPRPAWDGPLPPPSAPPPEPINYWGFQEQPIWQPDFNQWGFWFFGVWIPL